MGDHMCDCGHVMNDHGYIQRGLVVGDTCRGIRCDCDGFDLSENCACDECSAELAEGWGE